MDLANFGNELISKINAELRMKLKFRSDSTIEHTAFYVSSEECIEVNEGLLEEEARAKNINLKDYTYIIISHEIGHALDKQLPKIDTKIQRFERILKTQGYKEEIANRLMMCKLEAEQNAWNHAENIVTPKFNLLFNQIKSESLKKSKENFKLEKQLLKLKLKR
ncbi:hypothetical protein O0Q50_30590 [Priestia aryabhattai]|uniref:Peptidase M48 domain-containing protein n=1 Tax=Priestia aryabhattai TaxID=412384 RepID=A0AAX6NI37_PRIAR|nr:hypothetical protein [Priestia aryabhattai]MDU9695553.1 hypothetical protein [Priestia aryabhattai]